MIKKTNLMAVSEVDLLSVYRLQPGRQNNYSTINTAHAFMGQDLTGYGEQRKHFPHVRETTAQQLDAIKALSFTEKGHICCVTHWAWEIL